MSTIVVLDIGKTNAKVSVVDGVSATLVSSETTTIPSVEAEPYLHLDTESIWRWYLQQLAHIQQSRSVDTIVVTAHGATAALVNDDGLVLPVMDYEFAGVDDYRDEYDRKCDPFSSTFSPRLPLGLNLGRQLYWQRQRCPQQFAKARYLLPYAQYWSWRLSGKPVAEVSTIGSHTDLWNPIDKSYSDFAMREGFAELFPPLAHAAEVLGSVTPEVQAATGIGKHCKVLTGIHDSNASLLPWIHSRGTPFTVMSTGTWVIIFSLGSELQGIQAERDCTANVNIYAEPVACARFMGGREYAAIAGDTPAKADVEDLLSVIEAGAVALPAFADTGGPFPGSKGTVVTDRPLSPSQKQALAAVYCALVSDESLTLCHSAGDIIVEGAFARNQLLLQCLSVFRGSQSVFASADSTGTTMGAAMLVTEAATETDTDEQAARERSPDASRPTISAPELRLIEVDHPTLRQQLIDYRLHWRECVYQHTGQR